MPVCAAHMQRAIDRGWPVDRLYIYAHRIPTQHTVYNIGGICVSITPGATVERPTDAYMLEPSNITYSTCSDCTDGYRATLCPADQLLPGAEDVPDAWIRKGDLQTGMTGFEWGPWCYEVSSVAYPIPDHAIVMDPQEIHPCGSCGMGVPFIPCEPDGETNFWSHYQDVLDVKAKYPNIDTAVLRLSAPSPDTFNYSQSFENRRLRLPTRCYSIDLNATPQRIPLDAVVHLPDCGFIDCAGCRCADPAALHEECQPPMGLPASPCYGDRNAAPVWVREEHLPLDRAWFMGPGPTFSCYWIDPDRSKVRYAPPGVRWVRPRELFSSCAGCVVIQNAITSPERDPCKAFPPGHFMRPGHCDGDPPKDENPPQLYTRFERCGSCGAMSAWKVGGPDGKIIKIGDNCITATSEQKWLLNPPAGPIIDPAEYDGHASCEECEGVIYELARCESGGNIYISSKVQDLSGYVGQTVKLNQPDDCFSVSLAQDCATPNRHQPVSIQQVVDGCHAPQCRAYRLSPCEGGGDTIISAADAGVDLTPYLGGYALFNSPSGCHYVTTTTAEPNRTAPVSVSHGVDDCEDEACLAPCNCPPGVSQNYTVVASGAASSNAHDEIQGVCHWVVGVGPPPNYDDSGDLLGYIACCAAPIDQESVGCAWHIEDLRPRSAEWTASYKKVTGGTPAGTYTRVLGDGPATVTVV